MSIYFPPIPPVFVGGAQPYAPKQLLPQPRADNPPVIHPARTAQVQSIVETAWQPPPPNAFQGKWQPADGPRDLPPSRVIGAVSNPPFQHPGNTPQIQSIVITAWQPPPPSPFEGKLQPTDGPRSSPPSQRADQPPRFTAFVPRHAWDFPPFVAPILPPAVAAIIPAVVASKTPYSMVSFYAILSQWQPVPPPLVERAPSFLLGMSVDNPPRLSPPLPHVLWEQAPSGIIRPAGVAAIIPAVVVPARVPFVPVWLYSVLQAWQPQPFALPAQSFIIQPGVPPIPPTPPVPPWIGRILPIIEVRATYVSVAWSAASGYTELQVPVSALPSPVPLGPTMLVGFNLDGSYTLYRPLPQPRPLFGNQIVNQLPESPTGTTEVVVPEFI